MLFHQMCMVLANFAFSIDPEKYTQTKIASLAVCVNKPNQQTVDRKTLKKSPQTDRQTLVGTCLYFDLIILR